MGGSKKSAAGVISKLAMLHTKKNEQGEDVFIHNPHEPNLDRFLDADAIITVTPGAKLPVDALNGVRFAPWEPPADGKDQLAGQLDIEDEPALTALKPGQKFATGLVIMEPDGRVWVVSPTNGYGGYQNTFPKGRVDHKQPRWYQSNAILEAWEETGLKARIVGFVGDVDRSVTRTRYYLAIRESGTPADMGWESQAVHLVPLSKLRQFLDSKFDHQVVDLVERALAAYGGKLPDPGREGGEDGSGRRRNEPREHQMQEAFIGCLLGGAVGDALGAPVEFLSREQILRQFGPAGITDYAPAYGAAGCITDDTQMTLFTAEGLLRTWVRGRMRGLASYEDVTWYAYQRWLLTQGEGPSVDSQGEHWLIQYPGWLYLQRPLHARRAPGNTCLQALRTRRSPDGKAGNNSKGCGGVMRVAPVGLYCARQPSADASASFELAVKLAALTHGHPTGQLAAGAFALLIFEVVRGATLSDALRSAESELQRHPGHEETLRALQQARRLACQSCDHPQAIAELGSGWVAEEALAIAVYCALVASDFSHGVTLAVNHDGDSDSTGALAGNLLGAMYGAAAIPQRWLAALELRDVIEEVAQDLFQYPDWPLGEYVPTTLRGLHIMAKYPGC
ncbi:ADP-ribosylglycohydrolase family protein [Tepidimonas thermarum]|nr:ADP-ribosylglycohydrolase family protein [Tepidimonas thermarum]